MALTTSERTTELVRPAGAQTGGGAVDGTRGRAKSEAHASFEDVLARVEGPFVALDGHVDVAAVIAAGRPVDQQRAAIDQKTQTVEGSRRKSSREGGEGTHNSVADRADAGGVARTRSADATSAAEQASGRVGHDVSLWSEPAMGRRGEGPGPTPPSSAAQRGAEAAAASQSAEAEGQGVGRAVTANGEAAALNVLGVRPGSLRGEGAGGDGGTRAIEAVPLSRGGGDTGAAGGGTAGEGGRDAMARLVGLGVRQRGSLAGGNPPSPFKLEQESALSAQVSRGLAQVLKGGGGEITLRLRPEQLGEVRAQVRMENGVVSVRIEAASDEARALLERESSSLRSALEARGLTVEHVRVEGPARSAERLDQASSEMTREREDRAPGNQGEDRPADGDRRNHDEAAQGRAGGPLASEMMRGAPGAPDVCCAYGVRGWDAGASWVGVDGVIRLDATA